jgi:hypothetical protein
MMDPLASAQTVTEEQSMRWATERRAELYDRLMPRASAIGVYPGDYKVSLRSAGFEDRFELAISIASDSGKVSGELVMPTNEPLTIQLARLRQSGCKSLEDCIGSIKLTRKKLPLAAVKAILQRLKRTTSTLFPPQVGLHNDQREYELAIVGWSELLMTIADDSHSNAAYNEVHRAIGAILLTAGVKRKTLTFDPARYYEHR